MDVGEEDGTFIAADEECESCEEVEEYHLVPSDHVRRASRALSLLPPTDTKAALKNGNFTSRTHIVMGKCSVLWTKAGPHKSAEVMQQMTGCSVSLRRPTRCNSLSDSVMVLL